MSAAKKRAWAAFAVAACWVLGVAFVAWGRGPGTWAPDTRAITFFSGVMFVALAATFPFQDDRA